MRISWFLLFPNIANVDQLSDAVPAFAPEIIPLAETLVFYVILGLI